ncbi:tRNA (adenosine(37)-N6)-dimethylallyltransferase MiaA [Sphingorhabdus arenilitoris]|uniref:tRNA dimethylallyltransferase n=1 Tax=Sphingorhabdus arenilitoris TaxID=1490041 RepID=A0ABV8RE88_9SPHN
MGISNPEQKPVVALIAGPTASGKTALALHMAKRQKCTIINADSAQVYDALPILSAQPSAEEMASAPHKLFGYLDGRTACSAADWAGAAKGEIADAHAAGRLPILVGGTGLYLRTLLDGIAPVPDIDPTIRTQVRALDTDAAYHALRSEDAQMAASLHANDDSRIKRALEVKRSSGLSLAEWRAQKSGGIGDDIDLRALLLLPPRPWLHDRCDRRFVQMIEGGAIAEVQRLLAMKLPHDAPVMRAIGVPEIAAMLNGEITAEEAVARGQAATRQYAKRQYTWFRNQSPGHWMRLEEEINDSNVDEIETIFQ